MNDAMNDARDARDESRVLWRSRRGMLELDILLVEFARRRYPRLGETDRRDYRDLLALDDWLIRDWLQGTARPPPRFARIVERINAHGGFAPP